MRPGPSRTHRDCFPTEVVVSVIRFIYEIQTHCDDIANVRNMKNSRTHASEDYQLEKYWDEYAMRFMAIIAFLALIQITGQRLEATIGRSLMERASSIAALLGKPCLEL